MPAYPAHWEADVVLRDGATAHLRPIRPDDADAIQRFHLAQSAESIYLRFFAPIPRLSDRDLHRFTVVDHHDRVALVVTLGGTIAGVGRYDWISDDVAEVAFNIADAHHGRGLGSVLLEHLAAAAREHGVHRFTADVLPQNRKMLAVFADAGYEIQQHYDDGVISLTFDIDPTDRSRAVVEAREHRAESRSMQALLRPGSVALVGASRRPGTVGRLLLQVLHLSGYTGALHLVHPEVDHVHGVPAHRSLADVPGPVDLAVVAVPAGAVLDVVDDCAAAGVRGVLVLSGGFGDAGPQGRLRQAELVRRTRVGGMRLVGPSSWGLVNADRDVRLNVSPWAQLPRPGRLGVFCESGALSVAVLDLAARRRVGISTFLSAGERSDVSANDCLQYWEADEGTDAIALYLESTGNPRKFSRIARRVGLIKPVIVLTSGTSGFAAAAHSPRDAFDAMLTQAGCIRVRNLHQLLDVSRLLADQPVPAGDRVAVVANSPGLARLVADTCLAHGLRVAPGPQAVGEGVSAADFAGAVAHTQHGERVDAVVAVHAPTAGADGAELLTALRLRCADGPTPVVACLIGRTVDDLDGDLDGDLDDDLYGHHAGAGLGGAVRRVPCYPTPEEAVLALAAVTRYATWRDRDHGARVDPPGRDSAGAEALVDAWLQDRPQGLDLDAARSAELLARYGIEVWPSVTVAGPEEAVAAAHGLGWPVVLKTEAPQLRHRLDLGGVKLNIADADALRRDVQQMQTQLAGAAGAELVVQQMARAGVACIVRTVEDRQYGPVVSFGLGGDASELLGDIVHRIAPLTERDIADMVRSVRASPKLFGHRGVPPVDVAALEDLLARVACLTDDLPDVARVDLNPVVVSDRGLAVLSARVRLARQPIRADARRELSATS